MPQMMRPVVAPIVAVVAELRLRLLCLKIGQHCGVTVVAMPHAHTDTMVSDGRAWEDRQRGTDRRQQRVESGCRGWLLEHSFDSILFSESSLSKFFVFRASRLLFP